MDSPFFISGIYDIIDLFITAISHAFDQPDIYLKAVKIRTGTGNQIENRVLEDIFSLVILPLPCYAKKKHIFFNTFLNRICLF